MRNIKLIEFHYLLLAISIPQVFAYGVTIMLVH